MVDIAGLVPVRRAGLWSRWRTRRGAGASGGAAPGVRATAAALGGLDASRWHVVADPALALLPEPELSRGERMPVDHLVIGPPGVLVVASRSWNGSIRTTHGVLRQDGARRERDLAEVARAADAVRVAYELDEDVPVIGVLCFVPPAMVTGWIGEVLLCATGDVVAVLDRLSRRLDREQVDAVAARFTPLGQDTAQEAGEDVEVPALPTVPVVPAVSAAVVLDEAWAEPQAGA